MKNPEEISRMVLTIHTQNKRIENLLRLLYYANPEVWILRDKLAWRKACPKSHGDSEIISGYEHPNTDWRGTVVVGGKLARQVLSKDLVYKSKLEELNERR